MIVALAQISPVLGDVDKNLRLHAEIIDKAKKKKAALVVFPELSLTGYNLRDLTAQAALNPEKDRRFRELLSMSRGVDLVVGFVEDNPSGLVYNAAAYLSRGRIVHIHRKMHLPTFGMFDEARFFAQGKDLQTFDSPLGRTGLVICREFLHWSAGALLQAAGAETIITISSAPGRGVTRGRGFDTSRMWELMGESLSFFSSSFVLYCNRAGFEDGMAFAGGSFIYGPTGRLLAKAAYAQKELLLADVEAEDVRRARRAWPWVRDDKPEITLQVLQRILGRHED